MSDPTVRTPTDERPAAAPVTVRSRILRVLRRSWFYVDRKHYGTWRHRVIALLGHYGSRHWGRRLMILVGTCVGGNWSKFEPPTWHYRIGPSTPSPVTGFPKHRLRGYEVVKDSQTGYTHLDGFFDMWRGLDEDAKYEWKHIGVNQDAEMFLGNMYDGGRFYGANKVEARLIARYIRMWRRRDWWGLRSWLYEVGLRASVEHTRRSVERARTSSEHRLSTDDQT